MKSSIRLIVAAWILSMLLPAGFAWAEPGWSPRVITFGETRAQIESTPILYRPYRPLHFYGNTVRRRHYRGTALPVPRNFFRGSSAVVR